MFLGQAHNFQISFFYKVGGGKEKRNRFFLDYKKPVKTTCFTQYLSHLNPKGEDCSCKIDGCMATYSLKLKWPWQV